MFKLTSVLAIQNTGESKSNGCINNGKHANINKIFKTLVFKKHMMKVMVDRFKK